MNGDAVTDQIELLSDGDGLAVIGSADAVDRFLSAEGLASRDLGLPRVTKLLQTGSATAQVAAQVAENSGRWVKLTKESARLLNELEPMKGSSSDVVRAIVTQKGKTKAILEFARTPGSMLANPAVLAGAAGLMAQLAMQQAMDEITEYLAVIDEKVDDVLRAQKDAVLAEMIGVELTIDEAMTVRDKVGHVGETTWSKVQATSMTIATVQGYALRQIDALAEKLERKAKLGDVAKASKEAEERVQEWLAVLARCFQLQDAVAVLELDRVLQSASDELEQHRIGLRTARENRQRVIARSTERLMMRLDAAAGMANDKVLLNPVSSRAVVRSSNAVAGSVVTFQTTLGIEPSRQALEARKGLSAAADARDRVLDTGASGLGAARQLGSDTIGRARSTSGRLSGEALQRARRLRPGREPE